MQASATATSRAGSTSIQPPRVNGADPRFKSEKIDAYEVGVKAKLLDNALTANLAVFRQDLKDFQVLEFTGVQFVTFNVPKTRATGFELETLIRPTRGFSITNAVTYSDAKYNKDCAGTQTAATVRLLCGQDLSNAPKWTVVSGFDWSHDLGTSLKLGLNGSVRLESDRRTSTPALVVVAAGTGTRSVLGGTNNAIPNPLSIQDGNVKANLRASLGAQDEGWTIELWGNNIFDKRTRNVTFNLPLRGVANLPGGLNAGGASLARGSFIQDPRTYGVTARAKF